MTELRDDAKCERLSEALEAYADGELETTTRKELEGHLEGCPGCRRELALAIELRDGLRSLPVPEAPRPAVAAVLETARAEAEARPRRWSWLEAIVALQARPALAVLAATVLLVAIVVAFLPERSPGPRLAEVDPAVARATLETKLALAHFARANREIGVGLEEDVLRQRVLNSAARGVARSLALEGDRPRAAPGVGGNERG